MRAKYWILGGGGGKIRENFTARESTENVNTSTKKAPLLKGIIIGGLLI